MAAFAGAGFGMLARVVHGESPRRNLRGLYPMNAANCRSGLARS
jgi:hypothetical protein